MDATLIILSIYLIIGVVISTVLVVKFDRKYPDSAGHKALAIISIIFWPVVIDWLWK